MSKGGNPAGQDITETISMGNKDKEPNKEPNKEPDKEPNTKTDTELNKPDKEMKNENIENPPNDDKPSEVNIPESSKTPEKDEKEKEIDLKLAAAFVEAARRSKLRKEKETSELKEKLKKPKQYSSFFVKLLGVSSLIVAGCAAFFSVRGIGLLFAGSMFAVVVMASGLELAKLVAASYLYRYWKKTPIMLKTYLFSAIIFLIGITSLGIFGFLSDAFEDTKTKVSMYETQVLNLEDANKLSLKKIEDIKNTDSVVDVRSDKAIEDYKTIYDQFVERKNASKRILIDRQSALDAERDKLESEPGGLFSNKKKKLAELIESQKEEREEIKRSIVDIDNQIEAEYKVFLAKVESYKEESRADTSETDIAELYNKIDSNNVEILGVKEKIAETDIGSFKFIARAFDADLDTVVTYFMFIIVIVFDPLAVTLVLSYNIALLNRQDEKKIR